MNKITDFKAHINFPYGGPKFSLCTATDSLTCQIPNVYATFCKNSVDISHDPQYNFNTESIKKYLVGNLPCTNPYDIILNNYNLIISSGFKTAFDPCYNLIKNNLNSEEGLKIIKDTLKLIKNLCDNYTGYETNREFMAHAELILDPRQFNNIDNLTYDNIRDLQIDTKNRLYICCVVYTIVNSTIIFNNSFAGNKSFIEIVLNSSQLLNELVVFIETELETQTHPVIDAQLVRFRRYPFLFSLFFATGWEGSYQGISLPSLLHEFNENVFIGYGMNRADEDAFGTEFFGSIQVGPPLPLKWHLLPKEFLATSILHEIGHRLKDLNDPILNKYHELFDDIRLKWNNNGYSHTFDEIYGEFFCDIFGVLWLDNYLFTNPEGIGMTDVNKYNTIKRSYGWNCEYPTSRIARGHPHHSLRVNLLLLSKNIHNFLCCYTGDLNLHKFSIGNNPACKPDAEYHDTNEYYKKYLKYKTKYLKLKKLSSL